MNYLIDTNVISELRKRDRCNPNVARWFESCPPDEVYISVLTIGEIRKGIECIRPRDPDAAAALDGWLHHVLVEHGDHIVPVGHETADEWGRMNAPDPLPVIDSLLAATAKVRGMTLVTRNIRDIKRTGVSSINPFLETTS